MISRRFIITVALVLIASVLLALVPPSTSYASTKGRRNTTIALGAGTLYELFRGHRTNALILGAGTAYAYKRYNDSKKHHHRYSYRHR